MSEPASNLTKAINALRQGVSLSRSLITDLMNEGHDVTGLIRAIKPDTHVRSFP